jgi:serine/threonine protein phosphatase PrpC/ribosomal protein L40E
MTNEVTIICRNCGHKAPQGPKHCIKCGKEYMRTRADNAADLSNSQPVPQAPAQPSSHVKAPGILDNLKEAVTSLFYPTRKPRQSRLSAQSVQPGSAVAQARTQALSLSPTVLPVYQNISGRYRITSAFPLETCNFYEAIAVAASQSQPIQPTFLIREALTQRTSNSADLNSYQNLSQDSSVKNVLPHLEVFQVENRTYTVLQHPTKWGKLPQKQPVEKALAYTTHIGEALMSLHGRGYGGLPAGKRGWEIVVTINGHAHLSDLTFAQRVQGPSHAEDVAALASLFYYLLSGTELTAEAQHPLPQFSAVIRRAFGLGYPDIQSFLKDLHHSQEIPVYQRALRHSKGYLTHVGRVRDHNEDFIGTFDLALDSGSALPIGLYIVADGMGGQAAGELASKGSVQTAFAEFVTTQILPDLKRSTRRLDAASTPADQIKLLVQRANHFVFEANKATSANRGTTITATLIIGKQAYVANVGDSRTYLLRNGNLQQITDDHSLVYSLYKAGQIQKEEIYSHERKNEIIRSLGDKADVAVDVFPLTLEPNDKLLLCSDGLWEMVRDPDIQRILMSATSSQMACDQLIQLANHNGGEDNVSAIVITLE